MNFSNVSDKSFIGKILRAFLKVLPKQMRMPILQGRLKGKKWIIGSHDHGCWLGSYEYEQQQLFTKLIKPGSIVFDLGGHVGFYTLLASDLVGPKGKVFTFEPVPGNLRYLRKHLQINKITNVTVIESAVSDKNGTVSFDEGPVHTMGKIATGGSLQVQTVSLDELFSRGEIPAPQYMKIDIEGAEVLALKGTQAIIARSHPTIFLSTHGRAVRQECCQLLKSFGYQMQPIGQRDLEHASDLLASCNQK
jgi:FkbM family methyltransferase